MNISKHLLFSSSYRNLEGSISSRGLFSLYSHAAFFKSSIVYLVVFFVCIVSTAQSDTDFRNMLRDRSVKIVNTLEIVDSVKYNRIVDMLTSQYFDLNRIHDKTKESIAAIRSLSLSEEDKGACIKKEENERTGKLRKLHAGFITQLEKDLTGTQIEKIKDGMTYRVMPVTNTAYHEMIPTLTPEQKGKIYDWLKEARELAMDEGSSEDKHKVFGKFKGKINNYLSAEGYDMKKEEKAWQQRIRERRAENNNNAG